MTNLEKYQRVFCDLFNVDKGALDEGFTFANISQWDSMAHLSLISALEEAFDVMFETEDILHFGGYLNGIEILKKYGVEF